MKMPLFNKLQNRILQFIVCGMIIITSCYAAGSQPSSLTLATGESRLINIRGIIRVTIADPSIADVAVFGSDELFVLGKGTGKTEVYVWAGGKRRTMKLSVKGSGNLGKLISETFPGTSIKVSQVDDVIVLSGAVNDNSEKAGAERLALAYSENVENLIRISAPVKDKHSAKIPEPSNETEEIERLIGLDGVRVIIRNDSLVLDGEVNDQNEADRARKIAAVYSEDVVDLLAVKKPLQIFIESRIVDVDRSALDKMGVNWASSAGEEGTLRYSELIPEVIGDINSADSLLPKYDNLKAGSMYRSDAVMATLQAIINEGRGRIVATPHLLTLSGEKASLNVGGEIPVPTTTYQDNRSEVTISWEQWGINVDIEPVVDGEKNIITKIRTEVSTLDRTNGITVGQSTVPAKKSRVAETMVSTREGATVVISGLIQKEETERNKSVPFLSGLPGIGRLFNHKETVVEERELLIFLTPTLLTDNSTQLAQVPSHAEVKVP